MTNHMLPRMACGSAILLVALAQCGCTSMNGWSMAGQPKPTAPANPNDKETISYLGAKKPQKKPPSAEELQSRIDRERADGDRSRLFADQLRLARQYLRDKRLDDAKKAYERALVVRPNDPDCHHGLAVIADNQKQFDEADKHYEAALQEQKKLRKTDANLLSDYGYSQFLRGNDQQAERILNEALAVQPSHKGAMANLGLIYQKQGRPDEAMAMFRRGASDADAQKYMSQLFPQSRPPGGGVDDIALAQNPNTGNPRTAPPMPPEDIEFTPEQLKAMSPEQLKDVMNRKKEIAQRKRNDQMISELPQRRDFADNAPPSQGLQSGFNQPGQQWVLGGNGTQNPANSIPANQMPNAMPQQGRQFASNQGANSNPNGYAQPQNESLTAPRGTNPEMSFWQGGPVQNPPPGSTSLQGNQQMRSGNGNGWGQPQQFGNDPSQANSPAQQFNSNGLQPSLGSDSNPQYASNAQYVADNSASAAAAQLGMNAGPGGLFPVVHSDGVAQTGFEAPNPAGSNNSRMSYEFPSAPQFQNPNQQSPAIFGRGTRQGSSQNQNSAPIVQPSLTSDWGNFGPATASPSAGTPQNSDGLPSINNGGGANYRGPESNWGDPASQPSGSIPYSGPWPANASQAQPSNQFYNNNAGTNSPPMWNRGGSGNAPQPKVIGPATQNSSGNMPEDWPYAPARQ